MREIKFRGWNKLTERMLDLKKITPLIYEPGFNQDGLYIPFSDGVVLMQYAELKDKNDKEIYEGDILRYVDDDGSIIVGTVTMFRYQWGIDNKDQFSAFANQVQTARDDYHEVIGNIYENPELLG